MRSFEEYPSSAAIPYNFRLVKRWTQAQAAAWYGVTARSWRRYERTGAPQPLLNRIATFAKRGGAQYARWLT
jgi:hypothetical protein